jgi:hypothetical protein
MQLVQHQIQFRRPGVPTQRPLNLGPARGALFGLAAGHLDVAQFGVGHQDPVDEQRTADSGAERQQQHRAGDAAGGAVLELRQPGRVRIVDGGDRPAQALGRKLRQRLSDPCLVEIGRGAHRAVANHAGKGQAHRMIARHFAHDGCQRVKQCIGGALRRCGRGESFAGKLAGLQIDQRALDR